MELPSEPRESAQAYFQAGDFDRAEQCCHTALGRDPRCGDALYLLGLMAQRRGDLDGAVRHLREAVASAPERPDFHAALAGALSARREFGEAASVLRRLVRLRPDSAGAHTELAMVLRGLGELETAIASFEQAVRLAPDDPFMHLRLFTALHCNGQFERGWAEYDWRLRLESHPEAGMFRTPQWDGSPLDGRTILLVGEGGLGDQIQFVRYAPLVKAHGGTVVATCHPRLQRLLRACPGVDHIHPRRSQDPMPACDTHVFAMSLPRILRTTLDTIPADVPYLAPDPVRAQGWRKRLDGIGGLRIGINWEGNRGNVEGRNRTLPADGFFPLAAMKGVRLFSLQRGAGRERLADFPGDAGVVDLEQSLGDLADTAAAMEPLDLVITNDTSVAHLAGALGKPVWVLLATASCWRWLEGRDDSPWYPTMRLFRRDFRESWYDVFARVQQALVEVMEGVNTKARDRAISRPHC
jgi:hypothetical protein